MKYDYCFRTLADRLCVMNGAKSNLCVPSRTLPRRGLAATSTRGHAKRNDNVIGLRTVPFACSNGPITACVRLLNKY